MQTRHSFLFKKKIFLIILFIFCIFFHDGYSQNHPGTGTIAPCGSCVPSGWTLDAGSPDVSDAAGWGFSGLGTGQTAWKNTIPPIPNGETRWLSAHSTEVASMNITGLTSGTSYTLEFYFMTALVGSPQLGGYGGILSKSIRYKIDNGAVVSRPIAASDTWYKESVVFTASGTSAKFTFLGGDHDGFFPGSAATEGDLTNISFKPNGTVPTTPTCPTVNLTATPFVSICSGQSTTLTASGPSNNYTYTWMPGNTTGKTLTVSPTDTTAYQITADSAGCKKTVNSIVIVNPVPVVSATSATICPGQTAALTASGAQSYSWSPGTNLSATTGANVNSTPPGNATYIVTGTSDGCSSTAQSSVTIAGSLGITVNSATICAGGTAALTAAGGTTYSWSPGTNLSATTGASVNSTSPSNITYIVTGTTNGCSGTAQATVTISPALSISVSSTTVCPGLSGTITASGANSYVWSDNSTSASLAKSPVTTTSYTVVGTAAGCSGTGVGTITIDIKDDPSFSYTPSTVCKLGGSDPMATVTGKTGGTFSCPDGNLVISSSTGQINLASTPIGTYTVTYTTNGTCPDSKTYIVAIVNAPDATFSYGGPYCQGDTPNALPTFPAGSSAGTFSSSGGLIFVNALTGEVNLATSTPNVYTVTNTIAAGGGCSAATATNTITINAIPATDVNDVTVCSGSSATLTASGASTYSWSNGGGTSGFVNVTPGASTSYIVTGTTAGCSSTAQGNITVTPNPTSTFTVTNVCEGVASTIGYTGNAPGTATYNWNFGGGTIISGSNQGPYTVSWAIAGSPNVTLTVTDGTCVSSPTTVPVTVSPKPTVTVNSPTICNGQSATLNAGGATNYSWNTGPTTPSITVSPTNPSTVYTVTGTTAAGCSDVANATVTVNPVPTSTFTAPAACVGETKSITYTGNGLAGDTYTWNFAGGTAVPGTGKGPHTISWATGGTKNLTLTVSNANCTSASTPVSVLISSPPSIGIVSQTICRGLSGTLLATGTSTAFLWSTGETTNSITKSPSITTTYTVTGNPQSSCSNKFEGTIFVSEPPIISPPDTIICKGGSATLSVNGANSYLWSTAATTASITVNPTNTETYSVIGFTGLGCSDTAYNKVTVIKPNADFSLTPTIAGVFDPVITFTDKSQPEIKDWNWDFGDGETSSTQNPVHEYPKEETTYTVTLTIKTKDKECPETYTRTVVIGPEFSFYIPNAFSPNNDDVNDVFGARGSGILKFQLLVFDRWGNQIFSANDINKFWDGKANHGAEMAQQDVYVWKVKLTDVFKKDHDYIGTVALIKGN